MEGYEKITTEVDRQPEWSPDSFHACLPCLLLMHKQKFVRSVLEKLLITTDGPAAVRVSGPARAEEGQSVALRCETSPSSPPASIAWRVNGGCRGMHDFSLFMANYMCRIQ